MSSGTQTIVSKLVELIDSYRDQIPTPSAPVKEEEGPCTSAQLHTLIAPEPHRQPCPAHLTRYAERLRAMPHQQLATLHNKYLSDFGLITSIRTTRAISPQHHYHVCVQVAASVGYTVLGGVSENKRNGRYIDPVRRDLTNDTVVFLGKSSRHTELSLSPFRLLPADTTPL